MAREVKPGHYWNGKLSQTTYDALIYFAKESGLTQTSLVERAIRCYVEQELKKSGMHTGVVTMEDFVKQAQIKERFDDR